MDDIITQPGDYLLANGEVLKVIFSPNDIVKTKWLGFFLGKDGKSYTSRQAYYNSKGFGHNLTKNERVVSFLRPDFNDWKQPELPDPPETLRDKYAMFALAGILASDRGGINSVETALAFADNVMEKRKKGNEYE